MLEKRERTARQRVPALQAELLEAEAGWNGSVVPHRQEGLAPTFLAPDYQQVMNLSARGGQGARGWLVEARPVLFGVAGRPSGEAAQVPHIARVVPGGGQRLLSAVALALPASAVYITREKTEPGRLRVCRSISSAPSEGWCRFFRTMGMGRTTWLCQLRAKSGSCVANSFISSASPLSVGYRTLAARN